LEAIRTYEVVKKDLRSVVDELARAVDHDFNNLVFRKSLELLRLNQEAQEAGERERREERLSR